MWKKKIVQYSHISSTIYLLDVKINCRIEDVGCDLKVSVFVRQKSDTNIFVVVLMRMKQIFAISELVPFCMLTWSVLLLFNRIKNLPGTVKETWRKKIYFFIYFGIIQRTIVDICHTWCIYHKLFYVIFFASFLNK